MDNNTNNRSGSSIVLTVLGTLFLLVFIALPLWVIALKEGHDFLVDRHARHVAVVQPDTTASPSINVSVNGSNGCGCNNGCCNTCGCNTGCCNAPAPCEKKVVVVAPPHEHKVDLPPLPVPPVDDGCGVH